MLLLDMTHDEFITSLGGPEATLDAFTAQEMADALEAALQHFLRPGARVYDHATNTRIFWQIVIDHLTG